VQQRRDTKASRRSVARQLARGEPVEFAIEHGVQRFVRQAIALIRSGDE
jgi:hypothetical protein